jgi:hypothetical protein
MAKGWTLGNKRTHDLAHTLAWYCENYGLCLNTVRRNRKLLDNPRALQLHLLFSPGPTANVNKLTEYLRSH